MNKHASLPQCRKHISEATKHICDFKIIHNVKVFHLLRNNHSSDKFEMLH